MADLDGPLEGKAPDDMLQLPLEEQVKLSPEENRNECYPSFQALRGW
jgi:hypothetical protein